MTDPDGNVATNVLDAALLAKTFPPDGEKPYPRYELDYREVEIIDKAPGRAVALAPISFQSRVCFDFYVDKPGKVTFKMCQRPGSPSRVVKDLIGYVHRRFDSFGIQVRLPCAEAEEVAFEVPHAGWFLMWVNPSYLSPIQMLESTCPVGVNMCEGPLMLRATEDVADVWLDASPRRYPFSPLLSGICGEKMSFSMIDSASVALASGQVDADSGQKRCKRRAHSYALRF